jgi:hypothetical protein|tara:strand:+ start:500 stop:1642 length:1143 start_codon:yes stop_codon:yes gene_type:complete
MSSGNELQEMEVGTKQSNTAVNSKAQAGDPLPKAGSNASSVSTPDNSPQVEDLGGPTPDNYKPDDDSAKLKPAGGTLKQVRDVVNKKAVKAEETEVSDESVIEEEETTTDEVVAEEPTATEEVVSEEEAPVAEAPDFTEISIDDDVSALVEGEELSEAFKEKAKTILEAAVKGKVVQIKEVLDAEYEAKLLEEVEEIKGALNERVDSYLEYVSDEWFTENQLAVEGGLKEELTESFMTGLKSLFEEHYVSLPEDKYDVLESMVEKLDDMETKLNEQIEKNVSLNQRLAGAVAEGILESVSEGLADTQKEKLASLSESVEFASEQSYREKLETLKESYFPSKKNTPASAKSESLSEGVDHAGADVSGTMAAYMNTLRGLAK